MSDAVVAALISGAVGILSSILSFVLAIRSQRKKEQEFQTEKLEKLKVGIDNRLDQTVEEHGKAMNDITLAVYEIKAGYQQNMAVIETRLENLTNEVQQHNNFARRMPVLEEQIKVINHRIEDLERKTEFEKSSRH